MLFYTNFNQLNGQDYNLFTIVCFGTLISVHNFPEQLQPERVHFVRPDPGEEEESCVGLSSLVLSLP